ncbi:MAG: MmcQ/YjbR family DNA-binding protein [Pseudomonadota bacterium]
MTRDEFNAFCAALPQTTHVRQWGDADVWKIGGKVFAIGGWSDGEDAFTFKPSEIGFEVLAERPGVRPAPYMASRGLKWLQQFAEDGLSDEELQAELAGSYERVAAGLPKKTRRALGLSE